MPGFRINGGRRGARDVITLLLQDHDRIADLFDALVGTPAGAVSRRSLVERIASALRVHAAVEEEVFYPGFLAASSSEADEDLFHAATGEHRVVELMLLDLEHTGPEEFAAKARALEDLVENHHVQEETEMFRRARALLSREELEFLGSRCAERRIDLGSEAVTAR